MRLFVAINFSEEERLRLHTAAAPLRVPPAPVRWTLPDAVHLTLKFLGEVPEVRLPELKQAVRWAATMTGRFKLDLGGVGAFPNFRRARVYWVGVERSDPLLHLHASVEQAFGALGFSTEARPFHPHLTLGRVKAPLSRSVADLLATAAERVAYEATVSVDTVDLMRSITSSNGARYEPLARCDLGV